MRLLALLRAFLARDFLQEVSYRTNFIMQWVGVLASLTVWYFLGSFFARFPDVLLFDTYINHPSGRDSNLQTVRR